MIAHYSSLDTGAPRNGALTGRLIDVLRDVLVGALVTGYGSKVAAGWTLAHNHADGFTLGNGLGFINIVHSSTAAVEFYLLDSLADTSAALVTGVNRRSYRFSDSSPTGTRHSIYTTLLSSSYTSEQWCIVADSTTAVLQLAGVSGGAEVATGTAQIGLYMGEIMGLVGPVNSVLGGRGAVTCVFCDGTLNNHGTLSRNPLTGTATQGADTTYAVEGIRSGPASGEAGLVGVPANTVMRPVRVGLRAGGLAVSGSASASATLFGGLLRGILMDPGCSDYSATSILNQLGIPSPAAADRIRSIALPGGRQVVPMFGGTSDLKCFISLAAEDWS